ncbi:MAG: NAD(P)/FAD-dependent oxidoreductase [Parvularculaceae bacterium]
MARTRILARLQRALALARKAQGLALTPRALTRRQAMVLGAAAASACATARPGAPAAPQQAPSAGPVVIIGGGTAGLTVAYRLAAAGRKAVVYEAQPRFGGRMLTKRNFTSEGMFCELGGELVDTGHEALIGLANELGVGVQRIVAENAPSADVYDIAGEVRHGREMIDPATGEGAFVKIAAVIARDQDVLLDGDEWTARARDLDNTSLKDYLESLRPLTTDWAIMALDLAYLGEYGLPTSEQSALNLIDIIGVDTAKEFSVYGDSDEAFRIRGGSSSLPDALVAAIGSRAELKSRHELKAIARDGSGVRLTMEGPDGVSEISAERLVLTLPFTKLRQVEGIDTMGLSAEKLAAVKMLGYGVNSKLMVATKSRPWQAAAQSARLFDGVLYSDRGMQCMWETSRGQAGAGGVLTNFLSSDAALADEAGAYATLECALQELAPEIGESLDPKTRASMFWPRHPFALGSYSTPRVGQYTTLLDAVATPELGGRVHFAGEHTSAEFLGFMNGAVDSGERVAREILGNNT